MLADLYAVTHEQRYAQLAQKFSHQALLQPLQSGVDTLDGLHANTQIPKVIGFNRIDELLGTGGYGKAAQFFWSAVVGPRSFATGGHGDVEHFFPKDKFVEHLGSAKTMETCCTHNMMRLTRALHARDPRVTYFDYFERALFNGTSPADPESGRNSYFQPRAGYVLCTTHILLVRWHGFRHREHGATRSLRPRRRPVGVNLFLYRHYLCRTRLELESSPLPGLDTTRLSSGKPGARSSRWHCGSLPGAR